MNKAQLDAMSDQEKLNCVLEGTAYYASVHAPNMSAVKNFQGLPYFGVSLGLEGDEIEKAKSLGLTVKEPNDNIPLPHVVLKRKVKEDKTPDDVKPSVVDGMQNPIPPTVLIGNGSKVACKFGIYWYATGGGGVGNALFKVQVKSLVPYDRPQGDATLEIDENAFDVSTYLSGNTNQAPDALNEVINTPSQATAAQGGGSTSSNIFDD